MTIIKLLEPFEKTLENRRFKIILYFLTSIILALVAAYLEHIGLRPVHIIWCIWLLIIPVTYGIYFLWFNIQSVYTHIQLDDELDSTNELIQEQLITIPNIIKEKPYLVDAFKKALALFEEEKYEQALDAVDEISRSFSGYEYVKKFRAVCHFHLGIQFINQQDFRSGVNHLHKASKLDPTNKVIQEQLAELYKRLRILKIALEEDMNENK